MRRRVRGGLPAQPTSHVLMPVSRLFDEASEESPQFPRVTVVAHPTRPRPPSLAGGFKSPAANAEAAFIAAQAIATAKSLPEIAKLQSEYVQRFAAKATEGI